MFDLKLKSTDYLRLFSEQLYVAVWSRGGVGNGSGGGGDRIKRNGRRLLSVAAAITSTTTTTIDKY